MVSVYCDFFSPLWYVGINLMYVNIKKASTVGFQNCDFLGPFHLQFYDV
jgi:hypothetical protein